MKKVVEENGERRKVLYPQIDAAMKSFSQEKALSSDVTARSEVRINNNFVVL